MKWYIGQPIVAIVNSPDMEIQKGKEYVINGINLSGCKCGNILLDVGVDYKTLSSIALCNCCNNNFEYWGKGFSEHRFAPLDTDISELTEILNQTETIKQS